MKNRLILLLLLLASFAQAQTTGEAFEPISWDQGGNVVYGRVRRSYVTYPAPAKNTEFYAAINAGTLPVEERFGPSWVTVRVTYLGSKNHLEVEAQASANLQLKFERLDGTALSGGNPEGLSLQSGVYYGSGPSGQSVFTKHWVFGQDPTTGAGGIPSVFIKLTFKNLDTGEEYSHVFKPINKASRTLLFRSSGSSPPVTSTPAWVSARYSYTATTSDLQIETAGDPMQLKFERVDGVALSGSNPDVPGLAATLASGVFYGNGPLSGQGSYDKQWRFGKAAGGVGGIPTVPLRLTFKRNSDNSTYAFTFTPTTTTRQQLFVSGGGTITPVTGCDFTISTPNQTVNTSATLNLSASLSGADATGITVTWTGSGGYNAIGQSVSTLAPSNPGTYAYVATASKAGCANKTATAVITVQTPYVAGTGANLPSWETFNYLPVTTNASWPEFDSRTDQYGRVVGEQASLYLNGVTVRVRKRHGGAPTHISLPGGDNIINIHDLGTMNGYALYRGGNISPNPSAEINTQWAQPPSGGVGNDPIQHGDVYDNPSEVIAIGRDATTIYTKTIMKNWAVRNENTDAIMEQWVKADPTADYVVHVYTKVSYNRTDDQNFYEARAQEYPCLYTDISYRNLRYIGPDGNLTSKTDQVGQFDIGIRKNWVALENVYDASKAIGLWAPGMYLTTQWQKDLQAGGSEFASGAGYTAFRAFIHAHWNDVWYGHHAFLVGDAGKIRNWAEAQADPRNKISWKFNTRNGIGHFRIKNGVTSGFPTPNTGVEITKNTSQNQFDIKWPIIAVPASGISTIYIRYKATGSSTSRLLQWEKTGQQEIDALQANQVVNFTTINDDQWHTAAINVGANSGWNGVISVLKLADDNQPQGAKLTISWINTVDQDPEP